MYIVYPVTLIDINAFSTWQQKNSHFIVEIHFFNFIIAYDVREHYWHVRGLFISLLVVSPAGNSSYSMILLTHLPKICWPNLTVSRSISITVRGYCGFTIKSYFSGPVEVWFRKDWQKSKQVWHDEKLLLAIDA